MPISLDHRLRIAIGLLFALVVIATIFYNAVEHWGLLDSLYFSVATATTVGYGDLYPTHDVSKIFTVGYMVSATWLALYSIALLAQKRIIFHLNLHRSKTENPTNSPKPPSSRLH